MVINDRAYGKISITTPVLIDLIKSTPFQRLKGINQHGAGNYIQPIRNVTRFEHCIGAWYLSYRYKRPIEEQIASLLHDVPHTAFSHVIDYVVKDKNHEYHDKFFKQVVMESEIPDILKKHKISLKKVLSKDHFPLLDNELPDISVDRWDYFVRDSVSLGILPKETIQYFFSVIKEKNQRFYFTDVSAASLFAILFMNYARIAMVDATSHGSFFLISEAIKLGLKAKYITETDFFATDAILMKQLKDTNDQAILKLLDRLKPGREFVYAEIDKAEFHGPLKARFVDPWVLQKGKYYKVSDLVVGMKDYFLEFKARYSYLGVNQT